MAGLKFVLRSLVIRTKQLVPYKAKIAVSSEIHKEHVNTLREQTA